MIAVLGSGLIAARDLQQDLLAGRLIAAVRWRTPEDGWEACEQLAPSVWQAVRVRTRHWSDWKTIEISPGPSFEGHSLTYFISRDSLEKRYPLLEETSWALAPAKAAEPEPKTLRRPSWITVHDWGRIYAEIARRLHDASGLIAIPQQHLLVIDMTEWCRVELGHAPHESELRKAVKAMCEEIRTEPTSLKKKPLR